MHRKFVQIRRVESSYTAQIGTLAAVGVQWDFSFIFSSLSGLAVEINVTLCIDGREGGKEGWKELKREGDTIRCSDLDEVVKGD